MIDKCANPGCSAVFRSFGEGRVFVMEVEGDYGSGGKVRPPQRQYSWLCNSCCQTMTVVAEKGQAMKICPVVSACYCRPGCIVKSFLQFNSGR